MKNYEEYRYSSSSSQPITKATSYTISQHGPLVTTQTISSQQQQFSTGFNESVKRSSSQQQSTGLVTTYTAGYQGIPVEKTTEIEYRKSIAEGFRSEK